MLEQGDSSGDDSACTPQPPSAAPEAGGSGEALTLQASGLILLVCSHTTSVSDGLGGSSSCGAGILYIYAKCIGANSSGNI